MIFRSANNLLFIMLRRSLSTFFCCFLLSSFARADSGFVIDPLFNRMAMEAKTAIQKYDNDYFLKFVASEGVVVVDRAYSKEQVSVLLNDIHSPLFKYLYSGKFSIRYFFDTVQNPLVNITKRGTNSILISYSSREPNEKRLVKNCFILINDHWYLDGIFSCE